MEKGLIEIVQPDQTVDPKEHFYPSACAATLHPTLKKFFHMNNVELAKRYCQRHQKADCATLSKLMNAGAKYYRWGGADLIRSVDLHNRQKMIVIEMNSCPSGNKSVPRIGWGYEGFRRVMANAFTPLLKNAPIIDGGLAVFYDVNKQRKESYAYACMLAQIVNEPVYLVDVGHGLELPANVRWSPDGVCQLNVNDVSENGDGNAGDAKNTKENWRDLRAVFRYVTRRPWLKIPLFTKTLVLNPVVACLAGGRNKLLAAKAYSLFNDRYVNTGLQIHIPLTITNVVKADIPDYARKMNYQLVVKVPYSNCGVGVYTITSQKELSEFMAAAQAYDKFVVQGLISHSSWPLSGSAEQLHHVAFRTSTDSNKDNVYVADVRLMICAGPDGWMPVAIYSRRAAMPLNSGLSDAYSSWQMLGTNLSMGEDGTLGTDTDRLMLFDTKTFPELDMDLDDLIECYVQTVLAAAAIDDMCKELMSEEADNFNLPLFRKWDDDRALLAEIARGCPRLADQYPELRSMMIKQSSEFRSQQNDPISNGEPTAVKNSSAITIENIVSFFNHAEAASTTAAAPIEGAGGETENGLKYRV